jgi:putative inorganic carbon (hco3(-)) transporter
VPPWPKLLDRYAAWFPILLILTLPLEFTKIFFPVQLLDLSRVVILCGVAVFAAQVLFLRRAIRLPTQRSLLILVAFIVLSTMSWMLTRSTAGLKSTAALYAYLAVTVLLYNWVDDDEGQRRIWMAFCISGVVVGILGTILYVSGSSMWSTDHLKRATSTFGDPNIYARFLVLVGAASAMVAAQLKRWHWRWLATVGGLSAGVGLPFTLSRQGYILFFVALACAVVLSVPRRWALLVAGSAGAAFLLLVLFVPTVNGRVADVTQHAASPITNSHPSDTQRADLGWVDKVPLDVQRRYLIAAGLQMFHDHPAIGVGYGNFEHGMETTYSSFLRPGYNDLVSHTSLVTILAEFGVVGFLVLVGLVFQVGREAWRFSRATDRRRAVTIMTPCLMLVVIFLASQFEERLFSEPYLWAFLGLLYVAERTSVATPVAQRVPERPGAGAGASVRPVHHPLRLPEGHRDRG